ncbi:salicylate synthase [Pendulispora rubella]|uniref:Salicylate synthase n=1 Tax=Pendulispora rubella TaxID=2741070 RepID=A0ABZ2KWA0_9BACT
MSDRPTYVERRVTVHADPLELAAALIASAAHTTYALYERHGEWSAALGAAYEIVVDRDDVLVSSAAGAQRIEGVDLASMLDNAIASVPLRGFRAYGTASFELAYRYHGLSGNPAKESLLHLCVPESEIRLREGTALVRALTLAEVERLVGLVNRLDAAAVRDGAGAEMPPRATGDIVDLGTGSAKYKQLVALATQDIAAHGLDKVIASRRVPIACPIDLVASYVAGRRRNNPARSFLVKRGDLQFAGFSPETVLEVSSDGTVTTQPLAGTRALVENDAENHGLRSELLRDTKELAEHALSVRLAFEELAHVCTAGSVAVTDFMSVSPRGTVQHLASRLSGTLDENKSAWNAFQALFPGVTASGVPKREALEWIRNHEPHRRGLYAGAMMFIDDDGAMDAALILRTVFQYGGDAWLQAGAGIVAQSTPDREFEETSEKLLCVARDLVPRNPSTARVRHAESR